MRFGYTRVASRRLERDIEAVLGVVVIEDWCAPAGLAYARIRTTVERSGVSVGQNDMLIAAHAAALGTTLVANDRIFSRIAQLKVENWLRESPAGEG